MLWKFRRHRRKIYHRTDCNVRADSGISEVIVDRWRPGNFHRSSRLRGGTVEPVSATWPRRGRPEGITLSERSGRRYFGGAADFFFWNMFMRFWIVLPAGEPCAPPRAGAASPPRAFPPLRENLGLSSVPFRSKGNESLPLAKVAPEILATRSVNPLCRAGTMAVPA